MVKKLTEINVIQLTKTWGSLDTEKKIWTEGFYFLSGRNH